MRTFKSEFVPDIELPAGFVWPEGDLDLEIGCGKGLHAIQYARLHPDRHLIAIERTMEKFQGFQTRVANHRAKNIALNNLSPLFGPAESYLVHHFSQSGIFKKIFLLYPNPYPKPSQANKRWHNAPIFAHLIQTMSIGGELTLATNLAWYAAEAEMIAVEKWGLAIKHSAVYNQQNLPWTPRTHFERKYLERGEHCHHVVLTKENQ